jgi:hypothetical protein
MSQPIYIDSSVFSELDHIETQLHTLAREHAVPDDRMPALRTALAGVRGVLSNALPKFMEPKAVQPTWGGGGNDAA